MQNCRLLISSFLFSSFQFLVCLFVPQAWKPVSRYVFWFDFLFTNWWSRWQFQTPYAMPVGSHTMIASREEESFIYSKVNGKKKEEEAGGIAWRCDGRGASLCRHLLWIQLSGWFSSTGRIVDNSYFQGTQLAAGVFDYTQPTRVLICCCI